MSKTEMTPVTKRGLRSVRKAVMGGHISDMHQNSGYWSVTMDSDGGSQVTMSFSFKRDT